MEDQLTVHWRKVVGETEVSQAVLGPLASGHVRNGDVLVSNIPQSSDCEITLHLREPVSEAVLTLLSALLRRLGLVGCLVLSHGGLGSDLGSQEVRSGVEGGMGVTGGVRRTMCVSTGGLKVG